MTSQAFNLDLIPKGVPPIVHASQYDKGQTWNISILKDGAPFTIPQNKLIYILGTKPDGYGFEYSASYATNIVTATLEQQMTAVAGDVVCEVRITDGDTTEIIGSLNFILRVEPAALSDDTVVSDSDIAAIEEAIELANEFEQVRAELEGYVNEAEAWANGTKGGVPVGSSDPAYHKNSKYYADNFVGYVTDAQYTALQTLFE